MRIYRRGSANIVLALRCVMVSVLSCSVVYRGFDNHIIGVMVSVLACSVVYRGFENHIIGVMVSVLACSVVYRGFKNLKMMMRYALYQINTLSWIFIVLAH
jgi:hypothetical protein